MIARNPQYRERDLLHAIMLRFGSDPRCRIWRNNVGFDAERKVRYGLVGSADLIGITATGRFLAIECKAPKGRLTEQQISFRRMIEEWGGLYVEARCEDDVERALRGA